MKTKIKPLLCSALLASSLGGGAMAQSANSEGKTLTAEMLLEMARVGQGLLSPDGKTVLYSVSQPSLETNKSNSDLFLVALAGGGRTQLTHSPEGEYSPSWINGGQRIAFLSNRGKGRQLYSVARDGSDLRQHTEVEGGIDGYKFSPDESRILYVKEVKRGERVVDMYPDLPQATGRIINDQMYKHWDEWVESVPHIFVLELGEAPASGGIDILEGEPFDAPTKPFVSMEDVTWSPDGKHIAYASRKKTGLAYAISTNSDIYLYSLETGKTSNLTEGMMGYDKEPSFSPDGKWLCWTSMERDGYEADLKRLFVLELSTGRKTWLTEGFECDVDHPRFSSDGKSIYFLSVVKAEKHLHELSLKTRKIRQITSGQYNYVSYDFVGSAFVLGRQSMLEPTDLYRLDLKSGKVAAITAENGELMQSLRPMRVEKRWMKTTDGGDMLVWIVLPPGFDSTKKYPALLYCQGGPQNAVSQSFSYRWNLRLMAEQGYIVIAPNRHGVPSFGKAWNEQISGDYSGQNIQDYLTAVDEMRKESYVDDKRIGCIGASYGGYSVFYLAGQHEGRFAAFIAHAGIFNLEMQYMTTEELWFANWDMGGAPWDKENKIAQRTYAHSPHLFVDKWDTPILVTHGEKDYRILAEQGMAAFNTAQMRGIPSQLLIYPDENHWISKPQNSLLWQRTFFSWLDRWLK